MTMTDVRTAVVGVGHFGRYHVEKYRNHPNATLVAVVDIDLEREEHIGARYGVPGYLDYRDVLDQVDAISIATPVSSHYEIAKAALEQGVHVLVEKPIAMTLPEADELIDLAAAKGLVLQVGHQERYYLKHLGLKELAGEPIEIQCRRIGPFTGRSMDCNVVLDLMIHDIDLVHQVVAEPFTRVEAYGACLRGRHEDDVAATLLTDTGCKISLHASRVSEQKERGVKILSNKGSITIDLDGRRMVHQPAEPGDSLAAEINGAAAQAPEQQDLLALEIGAFIESVRSGTPPLVSGADGRRALATALSINHSIQPWPGLDTAQARAV
ncbi:MAG: Gfo/Idh/MocA family oxidoreductase [Pseudomonadota bacterium]